MNALPAHTEKHTMSFCVRTGRAGKQRIAPASKILGEQYLIRVDNLRHSRSVCQLSDMLYAGFDRTMT